MKWGVVQQEDSRDMHVMPIDGDEVVPSHIADPSCQCTPRFEDGKYWNNKIWIHEWIQ